MSIEKTDLTGIKFIDNIFYDHDMNRYGIISMLLLIVGCLGGVATGLGGMESVIQLIFLVVPTMTALAMILAVAPMKYIVYSSMVAVSIDIVILLLNVFVL